MTTKMFLLAVAMCVANSNAFTISRDMNDVTVFANMVTDAKDLADDIKNTIAMQSKIVVDYTNIVKNAIKNVIKTRESSKQFIQDCFAHEVNILMESFRSFFKSILEPFCKIDIIPLPNTSIPSIPNIPHLPLIGKAFKDLQNKTIGNDVFAFFTGEDTSVATSNNDPNETKTDVNGSTEPAAVIKENTLIATLNNNPDRTEAELNESNKFMGSASSEGAAQSKEIKSHMTS